MEIPLFDSYSLGPYSAEKDVPELVLHLNNKQVTQNLRLPFSDTYSEQEARSFIKRATEERKDRNHTWSFSIRDGDKLIGDVSLTINDAEEEARRELGDFDDPVPEGVSGRYGVFGYWLAPEYRRKGIMARAVSKVIEVVGPLSDLDIFMATTMVGNLGSRGVLEKCGFKYVKMIEKGAVKAYPREYKDIWMFLLRK